jgi:hypothetical protein
LSTGSDRIPAVVFAPAFLSLLTSSVDKYVNSVTDTLPMDLEQVKYRFSVLLGIEKKEFLDLRQL